MNKKGLIEDFGEFIIVAAVMILIAVLTAFYMGLFTDDRTDKFNADTIEIRSSYNTRAILQSNVAPGYTVADYIADATRTGDIQSVHRHIEAAVMNISRERNWQWMINDQMKTPQNKTAYPLVLRRQPKIRVPTDPGITTDIVITYISEEERRSVSEQLLERSEVTQMHRNRGT